MILRCEQVKAGNGFEISTSRSVACLNADKLLFPLELRHPRKGDSFIPFGMHGRKLISDYCTDRKMNALEKEDLWLLCSGKDIVWVVGERIDNRFKVDETTTTVFRITADLS